MFSKALRFLLLLCPILLGIGSTLYWLRGDVGELPDIGWVTMILVLLGTVGMTLCNVGIRWFRWHFLTRRFGARLLTRESFRAYFATLPLLLTPFYAGEALRGFLFARQDRKLVGVGFGVWLLERLGDAAALATWALLCSGHPFWALFAVAFSFAGTLLALAKLERSAPQDRHPGGSFATATTFLATTLWAWGLPIVGLWAVLSTFGVDVGLAEAGHVFSVSTVTGAASGIPGGIGVSGSLAIVLLEQHPAASTAVPWAIAFFRAGTVWFTVGLGVVCFLAFRSELMALLKRSSELPNHFDDIASEYSDEIPEHVKQRLLGRKTKLMVDRLAKLGRPEELHGLDLGCGQGWYATAMAQEGFNMTGVDMSQGQVENALAYSKKNGVEINCSVASAAKIPYPDQSFDFIYSINVLHHILSEEDREATFAEIRRVLKPGGVFFLHEMNTINPIFRFYMSYLFPLINSIDEGNERWILPGALPAVPGAKWADDVDYFTFVPDFIPRWALNLLAPVERALENFALSRRQSAHFLACLYRAEAE